MNPVLRCWSGDNLKETALESNNPGTFHSTDSCRSASLRVDSAVVNSSLSYLNDQSLEPKRLWGTETAVIPGCLRQQICWCEMIQ